MPLRPPIFLALDDGSSAIDVVVWVVAGIFWLIAQMHAAKKKQERQKKAAATASAARPAGAAETPDADELAEIFKRLGANVPGTPPPAPRPAPAPAARPAPATPRRPLAKSPPQVSPAIAKRLARVQQEAAEAARRR